MQPAPPRAFGGDERSHSSLVGSQKIVKKGDKAKCKAQHTLYKDSDGVIVNSDLNGSANIGRKAFPELFSCEGFEPDFSRITIIKHPDYESVKEILEHQLTQPHVVSKSKMRRMAKKATRSA